MKSVFARRRKRRQPKGPFWQQRGWQVSAGFVTLVVLGGLLALVRSPGAGNEPGRPVASTVRACPAGAEGTELPTSAPPDLKWLKLDGNTVPTAPSAGPWVIDGPLWSCFAHTPVGAVVAMHCILAHMGGSDWRVAAERQLAEGLGRTLFIAGRSAMTDAGGPGHQAATYAGFAITAYTPEAATVRMLLKRPEGALMATSISEKWIDGDWKVVPQPDGSLYSPMDSTVNSTAGFIMWGA